MINISETIKQSFDRLDALKNPDIFLKPVLTGFDGLDKLTTGLHKDDLIVVGARPGMGKTSFALNIACHLALVQNKRIAFFSLEEEQEQLSFRMLSAAASVARIKLKTGQLTDDERKRLAKAGEALSKSEVYIDDTPGITVSEMKKKLRKQKNIDLVVIDYLQLMSDPLCRNASAKEEISSIIFSLKSMAEDLHVPVLLLSQLPSRVDKRPDHRPKISDLKSLGVIDYDTDVAQHMDVVLFLHRDYYYISCYDNYEKLDENAAECIVAKNWYGDTGTIPLKWYGEYATFTSVE